MFKLYTDGGSRGNPGESAIAFFVFDDDKLFDFGGEYIGIATNNNAEYLALKLGLKAAIKSRIDELTCFLDSELVVKQIKGEYKVSNESIKVLNADVKKLAESFKSISFQHVPREENKFADKLVNNILDSIN